eukprot:6178961-Pleurochrysis_carterae.AAC.5
MKRPKSVLQSDAVAKNKSAADGCADPQINRSSSASGACTVCAKDNKGSEASMQQLRTAALAATVVTRAGKRRWAPTILAS